MTTVISYTSIPAPTDSNWVAIVTAVFEAEETVGGVDWGTGVNVRLFKTQNSATVNGDSLPVEAGGARHPYAITHEFTLSQHTLDVGLDCVLSGPHSVDFYAIKLQILLVKR